MQRDRAGDLLAEGREEFLDVVHHLDGVGAGLPLDGQDDGALVRVEPAGDPVVLHRVDHDSQVGEPHRRAATVGDDERAVGGGVVELPLGLDGEGLVGSLQRPGREVDVAVGERGRHLVDPDLPGGERRRVHPGPHRVLLRAVHRHLRYAGHHGDPLPHHGVGVLVDLEERQGLGAEHQVEHRLVCGVHLAKGGGGRHVLRELARRLRDGGLHVQRRGVDIALQVEAERDLGDPLAVGGVHGVDAGDGGELALQRSGDGGGHGLGGSPREVGGDLHGGVVDVGEVVHREEPVADHAGQHDGEHDQRGHHGAPDEELGQVHARFSCRTAILPPGTSLSCPTVSPSAAAPVVTCLTSTVASFLTR